MVLADPQGIHARATFGHRFARPSAAASTRRPSSVIRNRLNCAMPATTRSSLIFASPAQTRSTSCSFVNPCTLNMIAISQPSGQEASNSRPRQSGVSREELVITGDERDCNAADALTFSNCSKPMRSRSLRAAARMPGNRLMHFRISVCILKGNYFLDEHSATAARRNSDTIRPPFFCGGSGHWEAPCNFFLPSSVSRHPPQLQTLMRL